MSFLSRTYKNNIWKYYAFEFFRQFFFVSGVLIPFFTEFGHLKQSQIQFTQSWFMLWLFLLEIPTGVIADYWSRKFSLILAGATVTCAALIYGMFPNFYVFLIGEFFFALSGALRSGANEAFVYDTLKELNRESEAKRVFGRGDAFRKIAIGISAIIGSFIAKYFGVQFTMIISIIPMVIQTLVAFTFKEPPIQSKEKESRRYLDILKTGINNLVKNKTLRILAIDSTLVVSLAYFVIWLYQRKLLAINIPVIYFGYFTFFLVMIEILVVIFPHKFEKILGGKKRLLTFGSWGMALSFLLIGIFNHPLAIILFLTFAGGFGLTRQVIMTSYYNKYIPSSERATTISAISMMPQFLLFIINPLVGFLVDWNLNYTFIILGIVGIFIAIFSQVEEKMLLD